MTEQTQEHGDAEARTREIIEKVAEAAEPFSEEVAWKAIRAAYSRGYDDGLSVRLDKDKT